MVTRVHDVFVERFANSFRDKYRALRASAAGTELISAIEPRRSTGIEIKSPPVTWHPDASYAITLRTWPGLLIEVSYSQNIKDLKRRAFDFILESRCRIRMVVGIDINYRKSDAASYSVWRACRPRNEKGEFDFAVEEVATNVVSARRHFFCFRFSTFLAMFWTVAAVVASSARRVFFYALR
jgi:hypothetical protein